jgi:anti-sigma factor (TIGR02949 family)
MTHDPGPPMFRTNCEETVRRLWDYLDRRLSQDDLDAIDRHLADCDKCPPHFDIERRFLDAVRAARSDAVAPDELRARILGILRLPGQPEPGS